MRCVGRETDFLISTLNRTQRHQHRIRWYNCSLSMLAGVVGAICALIAIVSVKIVKARRTRAMDRAMRDYVRRAY
jgi:hypothetical protein